MQIRKSMYVLCLCCLSGITQAQAAKNDWAEGTPGKSNGASRDYYNSAASLPWKHRMGDWRDASDQEQGNAPYAGNWTQTGWTAGGGIEAKIGADWTAKVEYLYVDLGWTTPLGSEAFQAYAEANLIRFGLNRQFR